MRITSSSFSLEEAKTDLFVAGVHEGRELAAPIAKLDAALDGHLAEHVREEAFKGKPGSVLVIHTHGKLPFRKLALIGLGDAKAVSLETFRRGAGQAVKLAASSKAKKLAVWLPYGREGREAVGAAMEGALLAAYSFDRYKKKDKDHKEVEEVALLGTELNDKRFAEALESASLVAESVGYARDLVNTPALDMTPAHLLEEAKKIAATEKRVRLKSFDRAALTKMGAGGILAVAQGSMHEPYLLHLTYKPAKAKKRIVLVGKGVTFDSGGLSLKPTEGMVDMKIDMAGAAAVIAVFKVLSRLELSCEVHGLCALVENMPSGTAIRPGDIVTTMSGKTIEVLNTDAEGRVTLADSLHYGLKLKPDAMIDLATLTGACMVALGEDLAGLMTDDAKLAARLEQAAERSGDPLWRLPLYPAYAERVKGHHGDVRNTTGGRYAGAITAGLFLKEFVPGVSWAHLDIAGPAYREKEFGDYRSWGASGYGVRLLIEYLKKL